MKKLMLLIILVLLLSCSDNVLKPQEADDFEWTRDESPVYIAEKFTVPAGINLQIEAGTVIEFRSTEDPSGNFIDEVGWLEVHGSINAIGSEEEKIEFISHNEGAWGGIIFIDSAENTFSNCYFEDSAYVKEYNTNQLYLNGALHAVNSEIEINNCDFYNARKTSLYADSSSVITIERSSFESRTAYNSCAFHLLFTHGSSSEISACEFLAIRTGIKYYLAGYSRVTNSIFASPCKDIHAQEISGGLEIIDNSFGTGIYLSGHKSPYQVLNNKFIENGCAIETWLNEDEYYIQGNLFQECGYAIKTGAALDALRIYNSTFVDNHTCFYGESIYVYNSIIQGEERYFEQEYDYYGTLHLLRSLVPFGGEHIILSDCLVGEDPGFVSATDFSLGATSPCLDYGISYDNIRLEVDLAGQVRVWGAEIDLGSYEYVGR